MKTLQNLTALLTVLALLAALGYGGYHGYLYLQLQWDLLNPHWKPLVIVSGSILLFCTFLLSWSISAAARKNLAVPGKAAAYDAYIEWYGGLVREPQKRDSESFVLVKNKIALWGGDSVFKEAAGLYELLKEKKSNDAISEQAQALFHEMKKEIGNRDNRKERQVV